MNINWTNKIENIILIALTVLAVKFVMIKPLENQLERQNQTIEKLAEKEKYSYQILNRFEKKIKSKDGELVLDLDNTVQDNSPNLDTSRAEPDKKTGFLQRLFNSKSK